MTEHQKVESPHGDDGETGSVLTQVSFPGGSSHIPGRNRVHGFQVGQGDQVSERQRHQREPVLPNHLIQNQLTSNSVTPRSSSGSDLR